MKRRNVFLKIILSCALLVLLLPDLWAQNYGQIRAMKNRAETVTRQKNHFVVQVLRSYNIPCKVTEEGIVAQLHIQNHWYDVKQIEIVPVTRDIEGGYEVIAHEIFFYTEGDILHLVSAVKIQ
ncbi:MAG: hypothetical protein LJE89_04895 [Deltaproteobacteria bacterium]|nr:hypothetical protein [Deltaproteobacteria bacterium]